jgi:hypothetical protein
MYIIPQLGKVLHSHESKVKCVEQKLEARLDFLTTLTADVVFWDGTPCSLADDSVSEEPAAWTGRPTLNRLSPNGELHTAACEEIHVVRTCSQSLFTITRSEESESNVKICLIFIHGRETRRAEKCTLAYTTE